MFQLGIAPQMITGSHSTVRYCNLQAPWHWGWPICPNQKKKRKRTKGGSTKASQRYNTVSQALQALALHTLIAILIVILILPTPLPMAPYEYTPLNTNESMRILTILPVRDSSEVTCLLEPRLKHRECHYDALSYAWGGEKPTESIQILSQGHSFVVPIIPNLKAALQQLGHPERSVFLWVDAICINQEDKVEKSHQVPRMSEIYSEAENVRVWLGKEEENKSERALKFIRRILDFENFDRLIADDRLVEDWAALLSLMKRPWFGRRWVVQEIALAKRAFLHCGKDYVGWEDFADAMRLFEERQEAIEEHFLKSPFSGFRSDLVADIKAMSATRLGRFHNGLSCHES
jgi:hypothetical protein